MTDFITNNQLFEYMQKIESKIDALFERDFSNSNEIISMNQLCRISGKGREFWKNEHKHGRIRAKITTNERMIDGEPTYFDYYEFLMSDYIEWQKSFGNDKKKIVYQSSSDKWIKDLIKEIRDE